MSVCLGVKVMHGTLCDMFVCVCVCVCENKDGDSVCESVRAGELESFVYVRNRLNY